MNGVGAWLRATVDRILGRSDIRIGGPVYMRRWRILHARWGGLRVHHILRSDLDRELHDHPFWYVSLVLRGGYTEETPDGRKIWYGPGALLFRSAASLHRLEIPAGESAWTLVLRGPIERVWGFATDLGWVPWRDFVPVGQTEPMGAGRNSAGAP